MAKKGVIDKIKYNYQLLFHPEKITVPEELTDKEKEKFISSIYRDKVKLHKKLGADWFVKVVKGFDKKKFQVLNKIEDSINKKYEKKGKKRKDSILEKIINRSEKALLKKATTENEKQLIREDAQRRRILLKKQLKVGKSINYYEGVDRRVEMMPFYLEQNKEAHQKALLINASMLGVSSILAAVGIPILPAVIAGYQVFGISKNLQCVNLQECNLARIKMVEKKLVRRNLKKIKQTHEENQNAIQEIERLKQQEKQQGKPLETLDDYIKGINNLDALRELRKNFLNLQAESQDRAEKDKIQQPKQPVNTNMSEELERMLTPKEEYTTVQNVKKI